MTYTLTVKIKVLILDQNVLVIVGKVDYNPD